MVDIYPSIHGRPLNDFIAHMPEVKDAVHDFARDRAKAAAAILAAHAQTGNAKIEMESGRTDWYVVLSDEAGLHAANAIEYGRPEGTKSSWGPMKGVAPLHKAFPELPKPGG